MAKLLPLAALAQADQNHDKEAMLQQMRDFWINFYVSRGKVAMRAWQDALVGESGEDIVQVDLRIRQRRDILREWDFALYSDDDDDDTNARGRHSRHVARALVGLS